MADNNKFAKDDPLLGEGGRGNCKQGEEDSKDILNIQTINPHESASPPVSKDLETIKSLVTDPRNLTSNPFVIDWTTTPITAMKTTIDYMTYLHTTIPAMVQTVVDSSMVSAARHKSEDLMKIEMVFKRLFWGFKEKESGPKGILVEFRDQCKQLETVDSSIDASKKELKTIANEMSKSSSELAELVRARLAEVIEREKRVSRRETALNKHIIEIEKRGFWEQITNAFRPLFTDYVSGGFTVIAALCTLYLLFRGLYF
jgi:hypothetical protein